MFSLLETQIRNIYTTGYRKETIDDLYRQWNAFVLIFWKHETLRILVNRAYITCSDNNYLHQELKHIQRVFHTQNGYPMWIIKPVMKKVKESKRILVTTQIDAPLQNTNLDKNTLPYVAVCWS